MDMDITDTMQEIEDQDKPVGDRREALKTDISNLENDIVASEARVKKLNDEEPYTPISPEKANENKRVLVFLRKALENLKNKFSELDQ